MAAYWQLDGSSHGVRVLARPWTNEGKLDALGHLRRHLYAGLLSLPHHPELVAELGNLEVRALASGRSRVAAAGGGRDDWRVGLMSLVGELARDAGGFAQVVGVHRTSTLGSSETVASARDVRRRWARQALAREGAGYRDPRGK